MSVFANRPLDESFGLEDEEFDFEGFEEACAIDYLARLSDEERKAFTESAECEALVEAGKLKKKMLIRLDKNSDLTRRQTLAVYSKAKEANDPLYDKFIKYKSIANQLKAQLKSKYGNRVENVAKKSQRDFIAGKNTDGAIKKAMDARRKDLTKNGSAGRI